MKTLEELEKELQAVEQKEVRSIKESFDKVLQIAEIRKQIKERREQK